MEHLYGQHVGVSYDRGTGQLHLREICSTLNIITDKLYHQPLTRVHLKDAFFETRPLKKDGTSMGWVEGTLINPDDAPAGTGTIINFRPSSRPDFFSAVTGDTCHHSRYLSIIGREMRAFGLGTE